MSVKPWLKSSFSFQFWWYSVCINIVHKFPLRSFLGPLKHLNFLFFNSEWWNTFSIFTSIFFFFLWLYRSEQNIVSGEKSLRTVLAPNSWKLNKHFKYIFNINPCVFCSYPDCSTVRVAGLDLATFGSRIILIFLE